MLLLPLPTARERNRTALIARAAFVVCTVDLTEMQMIIGGSPPYRIKPGFSTRFHQLSLVHSELNLASIACSWIVVEILTKGGWKYKLFHGLHLLALDSYKLSSKSHAQMIVLSLLTFILSFASAVAAYSRAACQAPTRKPLKGCPKNTLLVGPNAKFTSVQDAVLSIPHNRVPYTVLILPGDYLEQVNVTRPGPLTLLGQTSNPNDATKNQINIIWSNATGTPETGDYDNAYTSTLTIAPNLNSSLTGAGPIGNTVPSGTPFGNKNFRTYNLNLVNDYRPYSAGPALALSMSYANAGFYYTQFLSYQDTV